MKLLSLSTILLLLTVSAWAAQSRYDPSPRRPNQARPSNPIDSILKVFNPNDLDYGCRIDEVRRTVLDNTFKEYNWWAAVVASVFVLGAFFLILHQHREGRRRELITARFVTQAENSLLEAQRNLQTVTARHDQLVETLSRSNETRLPSAARSSSRAREAVSSPPALPETTQQSQPPGQPSAEARPGSSAQIMALNKKIQTLQQDIDAGHKREDAARDRERNLQREVDRLRRQLEADQAGAAAGN